MHLWGLSHSGPGHCHPRGTQRHSHGHRLPRYTVRRFMVVRVIRWYSEVHFESQVHRLNLRAWYGTARPSASDRRTSVSPRALPESGLTVRQRSPGKVTVTQSVTESRPE
jgi:hypothetical protein